MDNQQILEQFRNQARQIWGEVINKISFTIQDKQMKYLASLAHSSRGKQAAIGKTLYQYFPTYTLYVSPRLHTLPPEDLTKVLKHEAIHIGIAPHNEQFRKLAREIGANISETSLESNTIKVQIKEGTRFKTIKTFTDEIEARIYGRKLSIEQNKTVRMIM